LIDEISMTPQQVQALKSQALGRALTPVEVALAAALESVFVTGVHDFDQVAAALAAKGVVRPSGASEPWTRDALSAELAAINATLDAAYAKHGIGA
jgi:hypothetical protein